MSHSNKIPTNLPPKKWYGIAETTQYFDFLHAHPRAWFFSGDTEEIIKERNLRERKYHEFLSNYAVVILNELIPAQFDRASYISFSILCGDSSLRLKLLDDLKEFEIRTMVYRKTSKVVEILKASLTADINRDYFTEDHVLLDADDKEFFKSITHEGMYYLRADQGEINEINKKYGLSFEMLPGGEDPFI